MIIDRKKNDIVLNFPRELSVELNSYTKSLKTADGFKPVKLVNNLKSLPLIRVEDIFKKTHWFMAYNSKTGIWAKVDAKDFVMKEVVNNILNNPNLQNKPYRQTLGKELSKNRFVMDFLDQVSRVKTIPLIKLDFERNKVCVRNGVIDLETKKLLPFNPNYFFTSRVISDYNPDTKSKLFDQTVSIFEESDLEFVQNIAGQGLIGETTTNRMHVFYTHEEEDYNMTRFVSLLNTTSPGSIPGDEKLFTAHKPNDTLKSLDKRTLTVEDLQVEKISLQCVRWITKENVRVEKSKINMNPISTVYITSNYIPAAVKLSTPIKNRLLVIPTSTVSSIVDIDDYRTLGTVTTEAFLAWRVEGAYNFLKNGSMQIPDNIKSFTACWKNETVKQ